MKDFDRKWSGYVAELSESCPANLPVHVIRVKRKIRHHSYECHGLCEPIGKRFVIHVNANDPHLSQVETLIHEWAHALAWPAQMTVGREGEHDDLFGLAWARVYRVFYQTK